MPSHGCCPKMEWEPLADLGHMTGIDYDLGRCKNCGRYLLATWWVGPEATYTVVRKDTAEQWLKLQGTEDLKKALKKWCYRHF